MSLIIPRAKPRQIQQAILEHALQFSPYPSEGEVDEEELLPLLIPDQGFRGKKSYAPPEMYAGEPLNGFLADNWSLGPILYFMMTGRLPWVYPLPADKYFASIQEGNLMTTLAGTTLSDACKVLLVRMLTSCEPSDRLTIADIRAHDWMTE